MNQTTANVISYHT